MRAFSGMQTLEDCKKEMLRIARGVLDGSIGIVPGARELTRLFFPLRLGQDPDALVFYNIESETGHLPLGEVRSHWSAEALKLKDADLRVYEAQVRQRAFRACEGLIERYEHADYSGKPLPHIDGVGVCLAVVAGTLQVVRVLPGSPAAKAGVRIGQIVQRIAGVPVVPNIPETWTRKLRGEIGTRVEVEMVDTVQGKLYVVELTRERIML